MMDVIERGLRLLSLLVLLSLPVDASAAGGGVLFDQAHGQRFVIEEEGPLQLSLLAQTLSARGLEVRSRTAPLTGDSLEGVRAVVISGAFDPLSERETEELVRFVQQGGKLAVMLHIGPPMVPLLHRLGVDVANGVLHQPVARIGAESLDFWVSDLPSHPLNEGVERIAFFGAWPLRGFGDRTQAVARTEASSWVDLDRDGALGAADVEQPFAVVVAGRMGQGEFLVFGDDALFQNRFLERYNRRLARNFARWLGED